MKFLDEETKRNLSDTYTFNTSENIRSILREVESRSRSKHQQRELEQAQAQTQAQAQAQAQAQTQAQAQPKPTEKQSLKEKYLKYKIKYLNLKKLK